MATSARSAPRPTRPLLPPLTCKGQPTRTGTHLAPTMAASVGTDDELVFEIGGNRDLRQVTKGLRKGDIGIDGITTSSKGKRRTVRLLPRNIKKASEVLDDADITFQRNKVLTIPFENEPGELDQIVSRLEAADVEADWFYPTVGRGQRKLALHVSDPDQAIKALKR